VTCLWGKAQSSIRSLRPQRLGFVDVSRVFLLFSVNAEKYLLY